MRFMVIVKANGDTEAGKMPSTERLAAMGKFNEEMAKAGVIEAGEGLHPTVKGARVRVSRRVRGERRARPVQSLHRPDRWLLADQDGPSLDEAVALMKRAPFDPGSEIEIRQVFSAEDFGDAFTPELREQEERTRAHATKK